jgi:HSP20 family protein
MTTKSLIKSGETFPAMFDDFFKPWNEWLGNGGSWGKVLTVPAVNITENKDNFQLSVAAPGLTKNDFTIDVEGNMLTISSEKEENREEKEARYTRKEYSYTSFNRSFSLPEEVNQGKIEASYADGVLTVILPKKEEAKKQSVAKHISVK